MHRRVRKTPKVWGGGVLFFWGRGVIGSPAGRGQARAKGVTKRLPRAAKRWAKVAKNWIWQQKSMRRTQISAGKRLKI